MKGSLLDGINKSLKAQKLVTVLDSYNHTHVGDHEITPSERYGAMTNCMDLLVFNINNDVNIAVAFPTIEAAPTAMIGMKHQPEDCRVRPHWILLMSVKQSVALILVKIQDEEASLEEITKICIISLSSYYLTDSGRNYEISNLHSELDNINDELKYYEQRAADRNAAIKAAKEEVETWNFELDLRRNLPTLYGFNAKCVWVRSCKKICMSTQESRPDKVINLEGMSNSQMNEGADGSQFLMEGRRLYEDSCKQSSNIVFEWLQSFRANDMAIQLLEKVKRMNELQKEVLEGYQGTKLENLDTTGERASLEVRSDIKRREMAIRQRVSDEKDAAILAGAQDLRDERETQRFAIHGIKMTEAAMTDMIMGSKKMVMNELLSTNHALRIIAGDAQIQREVAIAPKDAKEVLQTGGGATLLYGSESKKKVEEVLKHSKLIANLESSGTTAAGKNEATQQSQQQKLEQQILLISSNLCELWHELTEYLEYCTAGLLETIQLELDWTWVPIARQFMATVLISRTSLATKATGTNDEHAKVPETEFGQQPCAGATATAVRREKWNERACGS
ncbi:MAG: hypothetical protein EZS28_017253 [Streblomastix strix]|uniref:Uncharacterized protein n=1 Tax=Streblomastix strix TaxID=222440 RepID=A0A5J4VXD3_9EUKA|nr:MAG: hypothetical protein EZS28_017253 [Streblomastix strix]